MYRTLWKRKSERVRRREKGRKRGARWDLRDALKYQREVAASKTRRTYAKSNSSTYVPVAGTGRIGCRASCIFSVFVAGVQLRVTHCARLLAAFASPRRGNGRKLAKGAYSLESHARQVRKALLASVSLRLAFPCDLRFPSLTSRTCPDLTLNAGIGMHDKSVLDAYFRERLPVCPGMPGGDVTLQWYRAVIWCLHRGMKNDVFAYFIKVILGASKPCLTHNIALARF